MNLLMPWTNTLPIFVSIVFLSACGSSGSGSQTIFPHPLSSIGYAPSNAGTLASDGVTFSQPAVTRLIVEEGAPALVDADITVRVDDVGSSDAVATLTIDGEEFIMSFTPELIFTDGTISLRLDRGYNGVRLGQLVAGDVTANEDLGNLVQSTAFFVQGYDVDPNQIIARTGTAAFRGVVRISALQAGTGVGDERKFGFSEGAIGINADFDSDRVTGVMMLDGTDIGGGLKSNEIALPAASFGLEDVAIDENAFGGTMSLTSGDFGMGTAFTEGTFEGRFYGERVGSVGGVVTGAVTVADAPPILLQGGFVADDPVRAGTGR